MFTYYEAFDLTKEYCIYNGASKSSLLSELNDYILYQNHIDEDLISLESIKTLNQEELIKIGIKLYINE